MKEKLYKKEIWITVIFAVLLMLMGHSASLFVLLPGMQSGAMWGFPTQYIVPILLGWFGLAVVCLVMALVCNKFDDEMDALSAKTKKERLSVKE
jgi:hypothetical protein